MAGETFAYFLVEDPNTTELTPPVQADDRIAVVRGTAPNEVAYWAPLSAIATFSYSYVQPLTGDTLTATEGLSAFVCEPAAALAALTVIMPPNPVDGQVFEVSTTQDITAFEAQAPGGAGVMGGGPFVLAGNGGVGWRYVIANTFWYRRY